MVIQKGVEEVEYRACIVSKQCARCTVRPQCCNQSASQQQRERKRKRKRCMIMIFADVVLLQQPRRRPKSLASGLDPKKI